MIVNTISELVPHDPVVRGVLTAHMEQFMEMLTGMITRGQEAGEFRVDMDAGSLAEFLSTLGAGIVMKSKTSVQPRGSIDLADVILATLKG